eukprot:363603-Chlamydomonas_euryale.AAC.2
MPEDYVAQWSAQRPSLEASEAEVRRLQAVAEEVSQRSEASVGFRLIVVDCSGAQVRPDLELKKQGQM